MKALIFGVTGQDGSYLSEFLLGRAYEVHGVIRRSSSFNTERIEHLYTVEHFHRHYGDITDAGSVFKLIQEIKPDEVYNLAAMSHVRLSYEMPVFTTEVNAIGTLNCLEAIKNIDRNIKFYQASSSEIFGNQGMKAYNERTNIDPVSPYGAAKANAYFLVRQYRKAFGMFAVNGILFNHESERRAETFLSRKVAKAVARIKAGKQDQLELGYLDAFRDWGYAPDYVEAMWKMMNHHVADDFVIASGETHSVRSFVVSAFVYAGLQMSDHVVFNQKYVRPIEVDHLLGDFTKASYALGWYPKAGFLDIVHKMVQYELELLGV